MSVNSADCCWVMITCHSAGSRVLLKMVMKLLAHASMLTGFPLTWKVEGKLGNFAGG